MTKSTDMLLAWTSGVLPTPPPRTPVERSRRSRGAAGAGPARALPLRPATGHRDQDPGPAATRKHSATA